VTPLPNPSPRGEGLETKVLFTLLSWEKGARGMR